jgi:hypothetical protein
VYLLLARHVIDVQGTMRDGMTEIDEIDGEIPSPHSLWYDKYTCFGEKYGEEEHCPKCKDNRKCKYEYYDERY